CRHTHSKCDSRTDGKPEDSSRVRQVTHFFPCFFLGAMGQTHYNATGCKNQEVFMSDKRMQTIKDIAQLANVSKSTVSRALNNSQLISQETRDRIQAIAREHNFRINAPARNLSLRQSRTIALVTPDCEPDFFAAESLFGFEILGGIGRSLRAQGYDLLIVHASSKDNAWV